MGGKTGDCPQTRSYQNSSYQLLVEDIMNVHVQVRYFQNAHECRQGLDSRCFFVRQKPSWNNTWKKIVWKSVAARRSYGRHVNFSMSKVKHDERLNQTKCSESTSKRNQNQQNSQISTFTSVKLYSRTQVTPLYLTKFGPCRLVTSFPKRNLLPSVNTCHMYILVTNNIYIYNMPNINCITISTCYYNMLLY